MKFEIKDRDAAGRICRFVTEHGTITTPNLLPVVNPNKMIIAPKEMKKLFGTEIVITNSYIINKNPELKKSALQKGVHSLIDFDGPIMTDSGTFQSYIYGEINIDPIEIVEFQRDIGSDIGTILDVFGTPDQTKIKAERGVNETLNRAKQSMKVKEDMILACTVQGSVYPDLRERCAEELRDIGADFFTIGGVVPLMESQRYADLVKCIISSKKGMNLSKPTHLFGAGHPLVFPLAVALGCDLFDSSAYAKYASDGRMIFPEGTEKIDNLNELPCCCPVCSKYSASELKKMEKDEVVLQLAKHNLYVSFAEIKKIRAAIAEGSLWELVERRAGSNPYLIVALKELRKKENKKWLEKTESVSKNRALFYTGEHTIHRPLVYRTHNRLLKRYKPRSRVFVVFPESEKPYSKYYFDQIQAINDNGKNVDVMVNSSLGPVPIVLDEMYPFAQSVFPEDVDSETYKITAAVSKDFIKNRKIIFWDSNKTIKELPDSSGKNRHDLDLSRVAAVADMQFGENASKILLEGELEFVKSKKTGKIRNIYVDGKHVLSVRAGDGLFTLKIDGAQLLHKLFKSPKLRVIVKEDAVDFVKDGKSVFARFVEDCDEELRPFDECLIVDGRDHLLAVGRTLLTRDEMLSFDYGIAVKTRESFEKVKSRQ